ncbi:MAG TPA: hypothetical protein VF528_20885 [Pyrinomonadaceae bacterium]|jgi:hypothetical protein
MGTLKYKKEKDWKAKFQQPEPKPQESGSINVDPISPVDVHRSEKKEWKGQSRYGGLSLRERNQVLLDVINDIFNLQKVKPEALKNNVSVECVRELYSVVAELWPPDTDLISLLPTPNSNLRAMYLGDAHPDAILRNICRFGLYADELFVIDPFHNPHAMNDEYSPLIYPEKFKADTLILLHFIRELTRGLKRAL